MLTNIASGFLVFATLGTALFQLAIVLGAPLAEYCYGGKSTGKLILSLRLLSVLGTLFYFASAGHYLAQLGVFSPLLDASGNQIVNWLFTIALTIAAVFSNLTKSDKERRLWGSTTITMAIAALLVAL